MNKPLKYAMIAVVLALGLMSTASAQFPCPPTHPFALVSGESYCLELCVAPPIGPAVFFLEGPIFGPQAVPIIIFEAGCSPFSTNCNVDCDPITPPPSEWVLGGHPSGLYPDWYFTGNECIHIRIRWAHDGTWDIIIDSFCEGCICMSFEGQFPVELMDFAAVAGSSEIVLNWNTASESDVDYFEIMRDGEAMTQVEATNAPTGHHYSWVDNNVVGSRVYSYDLVSVDVNGTRQNLGTSSATLNPLTGTVTEYALYQNYPNPFNPETQIAFDLVDNQFVTLKIHNLLGQEVATVVSGNLNAGRHIVNFNGSKLASGVYLYTLTAGEFSAAKKLVLLK